jgi:hypothetical protein
LTIHSLRRAVAPAVLGGSLDAAYALDLRAIIVKTLDQVTP